MIINFIDKETKKLWHGILTKKIPTEIKKKALVKLNEIDAAIDIRDLETPFSNKLEALKGDRLGQYSIRINQQWRICFVWQNGNALDVEIIDYH
ncbi:MAG: type II toxin-antitoxin system RelE/ParE family toxin [Alphaproteobacteria bacterium]|nr:type II toxin-antitoxin system RelE/ParE family toxin [Alphaproteobacteria bacterium]